MRYAILSDIHGNDEALRAVFADIDRISEEQGVRVDQIWCLGDVVGYGPEPSACVRRVRARCDICIAGNHDWAAIGKLDLTDFGGAAAESATWTRDQLAADERQYLRMVPETARVGNFTLAHGSPSNPIWEYLISPEVAAPNFAAFETPFCVVGHSHLPTIFLQPAAVYEKAPLTARSVIESRAQLAMAMPGGPSRSMLEHVSGQQESPPSAPPCERVLMREGLWMPRAGYRAIVNPGSVGQPRDGDPRAAYVLYDSAIGFEFRRVLYDIEKTQHKIREYGLSSRLALRLARGI
jgi:diadenosine tetraphosphatase ApaH/serine/threonine PP2A family protein phosphatase